MKRRHNKRFQMLCLVLCMMLLAPCLPASTAAQLSRTVEAIPYAIDGLHSTGGYEDPFTAPEDYAPGQIVDVIVELERAPLLQTFSRTDACSLSSAEAKREEYALLADQAQLVRRITGLTGGQAKLVWQYTTVLNGIALRVPYRELAGIQSLPGVKNAFVAATNYLVEPSMEAAAGMGNVPGGWNLGYTGEGITIAVIDTGLDTDHEAFVHAPAGAGTGEADIAAALERWDMACEAVIPGLTAADTYVSPKVPFAFDYADLDTDVAPDTAPDANNVSHGTHVAGIAAGFAVSSEGEVLFSGVAPDAQLLILKAFPDSGAGTPDTVTLAALEDAVKLGADVINMSLGTDCGFSASRDQVISDAYGRVRESGISLICAAGNQYDAALRNNTGLNLTTASDPDTGVVSSPASYPVSLAVASADNLVARLPAIMAGGRMITYTGTQIDIRTIPGEYEYAVIGGTGTQEDYAAAGDLTGKVALVRRGELTFTEKVLNGQNAGAAAVIICDHTDGALSNMTVEGASIPAIFITKADGDYLMTLDEKVLTIFESDREMENPTAMAVSEFSSLGVTPELRLKPEITAPGGYIYSTLPEVLGGYGTMSGTSMATPYMAGAAALVRQHLTAGDPALSGAALQDLTDQLLMSTAVPLTDARTGNLYTPRLQGNGLVDVEAALRTPAYLHTEADRMGCVRPVLNLGDDPEKRGEYTLRLLLTNMSDTDLSYSLDLNVMAPGVLEQNGRTYMTNQTEALACSGEDIRTVTVPAAQTVEVSVPLILTAEDRAYLQTHFENGSYVEGFVRLRSLDADGVDLTAAFLGFYGDWTEAPILDYGDWYSEPETAVSFVNQAAGYVPYFYGYAFLGQNAFAEQQNYVPENFAISPNDDGYFDEVELQVGMLRNAASVRYTVTGADGSIYYEFISEYTRKTVYSPVYDMMVPASAYAGFAPAPYGGTDADGRRLSDGTRVTYTVEAELAFDDHPYNNRKDTWSFPVLIDTTAPELKNMSVRFVNEDGRLWLEGTFADRFSMMDVAAMGVLVYGNSIYGDVRTRQDLAADGSGTCDFRFDVTDLDSEYIYLMGYDSAYNAATYLIPTEADQGLTITERAVLLSIGDSAQVAVVDHSGRTEDVVWTSANEEVAAVNENGVITARASGTALVTATLGGERVSCLVGVRPDTAVESFRLNVSRIEVPLNSAAQLEIVDILPQGVHRYASDAVWTTSDPEVTGLYGQYFYADKVGTATITATMDGVSASCEVTVTPVDPERELYICNELGGEYPTMQSNYITDHQIVLTGRFRNASGQSSALTEELIWTTSDPQILKLTSGTIREDGSILAKQVALQHVGPGIATVTATTQDGSATRSYTVNVYPIQPLYLYLQEHADLTPGQTHAIEYSTDHPGSRPEDGKVFWKSLNEEVVTVEDGVLTAHTPGWAMIVGTLTSGYDSFMTVYVNETEHRWSAETIPPTCTEAGYVLETCVWCGESRIVEGSETEPLGHDWQGMHCSRCDAARENPFADVPTDSFYYEPVMWAVEKGITNGISAAMFGPNDQCMRAHVVTFLWRAMGSPEPAGTENPFVDVKPTDFYYKPVLWALEKGITSGMDAEHFGPTSYCNRAQVVTFLYRTMDCPELERTDNPFTDVQPGSFYEKPVLWAVQEGITNGLSATGFGPDAICNRAQIVTFLYRAFVND